MDRDTYLRSNTLRLATGFICTGSLPEFQFIWNPDLPDAAIVEYHETLIEVLECPDLDVDGCIDGVRRAKLHLEGQTTTTAVSLQRAANWLETLVMIFMASNRTKPTRFCLEPAKFPLQQVLDCLNRGNTFKFEVFELGKSLKEWAAVFEYQTEQPRIQGSQYDLLGYLGCTLSPLHSSMRERLAPEYIDFHDKVVQYYPYGASKETVHLKSPFSQTDIEAVRILTSDHDVGNGLTIRQFNPVAPEPQLVNDTVLVWFAGGGWMLGDVESDHNVLTNICDYTTMRVFNVVYRRMPLPHPFDDAARAVRWIQKHCGPVRVILGGVSAGALLAAVISIEMAQDGNPPLAMLLVAPSLNNTSDSHLSWAPEPPWLTPARMKLFQDYLLKETEDRSKTNWRISPVYAPLDNTRPVRTFIASMECDILQKDAMMFADLLTRHKWDVTHYRCPGYPHMAWVMQKPLGPTLLMKVCRFIDTLLSDHDDEALEMATTATNL